MYAKNVQLREQLAAAKKKEEENKKVLITVDLSSKHEIALKLSYFRHDIVQRLQQCPDRYFNHTTYINYLKLSTLPILLKEYINNDTITWKLGPEVKEALLLKDSPYSYSISLRKNGYFVFVNPYKGNFMRVTSQIAMAYETKDGLMIPRPVGYQLLQAFPPKDSIFWEPDALEAAQEYRRKRDSLIELQDINNGVIYDHGFKVELKPEQHVGATFLDLAGSAILADVMGKGKSVQSIAVAHKNKYRTLWIVPASLVLNWIEEIQKWTGETPSVFSGREPQIFHYEQLLVKKTQYNVISYESLGSFQNFEVNVPNEHGEIRKKTEKKNLWADLINQSDFDLIVPDEAHRIKNMESARSQAVQLLNPNRIIFLTGTPVQNRPVELFPMLHMIDRHNFPTLSGFLKSFAKGKNGIKDAENLRELLKPLMLRREASADEPITRVPHIFELNAEERKLYEQTLNGIYEDLRGNQLSAIEEIVKITRLKQVCSRAAARHVIELTETILEEVKDSDFKWKKVLIFTQYKEIAGLIAADFPMNSLSFDGDDPMQRRMDYVHEFNTNSKYDILIATSKASSEGLNITGAGHVIFTDLLWTPGDHAQGEGRAAWRVSDPHTITSHYMIAKDTIMEWIYQLLWEKLQTIKELDGQSLDTNFSGDILARLKAGMVL